MGMFLSYMFICCFWLKGCVLSWVSLPSLPLIVMQTWYRTDCGHLPGLAILCWCDRQLYPAWDPRTLSRSGRVKRWLEV